MDLNEHVISGLHNGSEMNLKLMAKKNNIRLRVSWDRDIGVSWDRDISVNMVTRLTGAVVGAMSPDCKQGREGREYKSICFREDVSGNEEIQA